MAAAAHVHRTSFDERLPWLAGLHTPDEDREYFRNHVFVDCAVWGAFEGAALVGILAFREGWVDQLYVLPDFQSRGVGTALLNIAKQSGEPFRLWTFQTNVAAPRFYEANGFVAVEYTDGNENQEREPDVLYEWRRS